jgi:GAF domain-containing protein
VILPLAARGRQLGSLLLESSERQSFAPEEFETYQSLAGQLALALDRQLLLTSAQRRAERERLINVIGQKIQAATTIEGAMQVALSELSEALRPGAATWPSIPPPGRTAIRRRWLRSNACRYRSRRPGMKE